MPVLHSLEVSARLHTNVIVRFCSSAIRLVARPGASIKLGVWFKLTLYHAIRFTHADGMTGPMQHRMRRTESSYSLCLVKHRVSRVPCSVSSVPHYHCRNKSGARRIAESSPSQSSASRAKARLIMPKAAWQWRYYLANCRAW
jgi:hypothetical protein